jgi:hypothetical protein
VQISCAYNHLDGRFVTVRCVSRRRRDQASSDPFSVLGLGADASEAAIVDARRRLAKDAHPDAGGSVEAMQRLNDAVERALAAVRAPIGSTSPSAGSQRPRSGRPAPPRPPQRARHDHPSFTIEVLPVEAFEGLVVVASWLGDVIHDDPPYLLEVALAPPIRGWCRLELVPDAGASTVSLAVAPEPGYPAPDLDEVRDAWIDGLNRLDWTDPGAPPLP